MGFLGQSNYFEDNIDEFFNSYPSPQLDELIKILKAIKETNYLLEIGKIEKETVLSFFDLGWSMKEEEYSFVETARKGFKKPIFKMVLANYEDFKHLYKLVKSVFLFQNVENDDKLTDNIIETCQKLTYNVEDFEGSYYIRDDSIDFFKSFQDIDYDDSDVRGFASSLEDILKYVQWDLDFESELLSTIIGSGRYLSICSAIKKNRFTVTVDDVIVAYMTILKIIIKDPEQFIKDFEGGKIVKYEKPLIKKISNAFWSLCAVIFVIIIIIWIVAIIIHLVT